MKHFESLTSFNEWADFYKAMGIDTVYARASFDAVDLNGDGIISKEAEFFTEDMLKSSIMFRPG